MSALCFLFSNCRWWKVPFAIAVCRFISVSLPIKGRQLLFWCPPVSHTVLVIWIDLNRTGSRFLLNSPHLSISLALLFVSLVDCLTPFLPISCSSSFWGFWGPATFIVWYWWQRLAQSRHETLADVCADLCASSLILLAAEAPPPLPPPCSYSSWCTGEVFRCFTYFCMFVHSFAWQIFSKTSLTNKKCTSEHDDILGSLQTLQLPFHVKGSLRLKAVAAHSLRKMVFGGCTGIWESKIFNIVR